MNRRKFLTTAATASAALVGLNSTRVLLAADSATPEAKGVPTKNYKLTPPEKGSIPVAIVISNGVNIIDFSGPWGAFDSVMLKNDQGETDGPFDVFSVSEKVEIVTAGGLKLMPGYSFADCPSPRIVVVPAQMGSDAMIDWLRKVAVTADITMSVCTGAFKLAKAGLL
nr:twin-arginine translocation signal domain-containing protein [Verrucomicrobiota bacterium]